jgi:hypothetical protein
MVNRDIWSYGRFLAGDEENQRLRPPPIECGSDPPVENGVPMQVFTFFCVEPDGSVPRFDVAPYADDQAARRRAFELIDMHHRCDLIEVWRGSTRVFDVPAQRVAAA